VWTLKLGGWGGASRRRVTADSTAHPPPRRCFTRPTSALPARSRRAEAWGAIRAAIQLRWRFGV
jgi:hypothetical protein